MDLDIRDSNCILETFSLCKMYTFWFMTVNKNTKVIFGILMFQFVFVDRNLSKRKHLFSCLNNILHLSN